MVVMECVTDNDHRTHRPVLILFHGLLQHAANIDVTATAAFGSIHRGRHVIGISFPIRCDLEAAHALVVVIAVEGKFHFQAAAAAVEHLSLQRLGALPAGTAAVIGQREQDTRGARRDRLLVVLAEHAPERISHQLALEPGGDGLGLLGAVRPVHLGSFFVVRSLPITSSPTSPCT